MENYPQLLMYKASAGSGKTFTLTVQYIKQLVEDTYAYRHILAVTFTNKATAEMKKRILEQLYGLAHRLPGSNGYLKALVKETSKSEQEIQQAAKEALRNIIHDYSRFRLETIDSFFQSVMRNLARELELGANMSIELNDADILSEAVDALIEKLDRHSPVLYWLLEYIEERIADDKRWNVSNDIKKFGRNIFNEVFVTKGAELRRKLEDPQFIPSYRKSLQELRRDALEEMKGFSTQFFDTLELNGLTPADLKNGTRGISSYFNKLANGTLGDEVRNATVEKSLENADNWTSKTSARRDVIRSLAASELIPLLEEAEKFRPRNNILLNSCDLSLRYLNNLRLLASIDREVHLQNQIHNRFLLADTNALLHGLISKGDASFVYEKMGTNIDTIMIDEFQDTSRMQWNNFRLLLEDCLAQKEGSLIVGDIKQSIYRWRGGDWKILAELDSDKALRARECTLDTNWRSESRIIRFNNRLFTAACGVLDHQYREEQGKPCTPLLDAYRDVCQKTSKKEELGYVKIRFLADNKEEPYAEATLKELAEEVGQLIGQNVKPNDIAILVRKNKAIPPIADYFEQHTPYRIVSDEAFRLDASPAVGLLIDGLRCLVSPEDRIARARMAAAFQHEVLHRDIDLNTLLLDNTDQYLPAEFVARQAELKLMPLYELLEKLSCLFDVKQISQQEAYLCAFYDAVTEYMQNNSSELTAFLSYWDEQLHEKTIPSGEISGIRILSIHKSKGLEFHTVLIPFCDWKLENETNNHLVWCSVAGTGTYTDCPPFNMLDLVPVDYSSTMAESVYCDTYLEERLQLWVDNLNLLYVAFTRACKNLIVWAKQSSRGTVSQLLSAALPLIEELENTDDTYWYGELCPSAEKEKKEDPNRLAAQADGIPIQIESMEADFEFKQSNRSADFIRGEEDEPEQYIRQGQLLHAVFASIKTENDLEQALGQWKLDGIMESEEQERQILKLARWALGNPRVKEWYNGTWELYNECSIIYTDEKGAMQTRRPDRVMMKDGETVVVDFKFGKKKDCYRMQVREYMELLQRMGYPRVKGYLWYVFANELEEVD